MFRGVTSINVDDKGRVAMPTRYRDPLRLHAQSQLVVTIDTEERCLLIYPMPEWEEIEQKVEALPSFNRAARRVQRLLIGHATEANLDSHGRILLPQPLREYAQLEKVVVLVGQGKKFELWDEKHWNSQRDSWLEAQAEEEDVPVDLKMLSL